MELEDEVLILDGGLATALESRGYDVSGPLWSANLLRTHPEAIEQLHYDYFAAGARCVISASYQASYEGFAAQGVGPDETTALLRRSVTLARSARDRFHRDHPQYGRSLYVAASIGPYGAISHDGAEYRGDYGLSVEQLVVFHARRFGILAASGADVLACETIPLLDEARALGTLLARHPESRAWMSFTSADGSRTSHGESLTECARLLDDVPNVIAIGVNCVRPAVVDAAIRALRAGTDKPIVVYPNSGETWDGRSHDWHGSPQRESLADLASQWVDAGARIIGGCCRTGPRDITALSRAVGALAH
jgi:homocysteine S-methyltransferase